MGRHPIQNASKQLQVCYIEECEHGADKKGKIIRDVGAESTRQKKQRKTIADRLGRFQEALAIARDHGLLAGGRTEVLRGRMPKALVEEAKARSGATSDTQLLELALATVAVIDDYPAWLLSQTGTVRKDLDLEF